MIFSFSPLPPLGGTWGSPLLLLRSDLFFRTLCIQSHVNFPSLSCFDEPGDLCDPWFVLGICRVVILEWLDSHFFLNLSFSFFHILTP